MSSSSLSLKVVILVLEDIELSSCPCLPLEGIHTHSIFPLPCTKPPNPIPHRKVDIMLRRLCSGHSLLAEHSHKMKIALSLKCVCGKDRGTIHHFLLHSPIDHQAREVLSHEIELGYINTNTPGYHRRLDVNTLLGANRHLCSDIHGEQNNHCC